MLPSGVGMRASVAARRSQGGAGRAGAGTRVRAMTAAIGACATAAVLLAGCAGPSTTAPPHVTATVPTGPILVGTNVDVSHAPGAQDEVSAAVDPADPSILLAGSNNFVRGTNVRVYGSTDAGAHWTSDVLPVPPGVDVTFGGDQSVAIGPNHEQVMSFLAFVQSGYTAGKGTPTLFVATRTGPSAQWQVDASAVDGIPQAGTTDDKDMLAFDNNPASPYHGRLYAAWTRQHEETGGTLMASASADGGRTWSAAVPLLATGRNWGATFAVAPDGTVTIAWSGEANLWISKSRDGGQHFSTPSAFGSCVTPMNPCLPGGADIPAQAAAGVRANPALVYVPASGSQPAQVIAFYADGDGSADTHIYAAHFDAATLTPLGTPTALSLGASGTDQFLPAAAYDPSDHGLWACAYTTSVTAVTNARYTCTASTDGGTTFLPGTPAASVASDETARGADTYGTGSQYGDYTALVAANGLAHAFWTDSRDLYTQGEEIYTATLRLNSAYGG